MQITGRVQTKKKEAEKNECCYSCIWSESHSGQNGEHLKNATVISVFSRDELRCEKKMGNDRKIDDRKHKQTNK